MGSPLPVKVDYCLFCLCGAPLSRWGKGALFLYDVLMVGSITYVHMLPNMALKPLAANVPPRRMKGYF